MCRVKNHKHLFFKQKDGVVKRKTIKLKQANTPRFIFLRQYATIKQKIQNYNFDDQYN